MTPEGRATAAYRAWEGAPVTDLINNMAAAIVEAVAEERERCAKIADIAENDRDIGNVEYAGSYLAATIAARIREGK